MSTLAAIPAASACTALAALHVINGAGIRVDESAVRSGLATAQWPGRFEQVVAADRTVVFDAADPVQVVAAERLFGDIMVLGLELGGTITGEHGIGTLKRELLAREVGPVAMQVQRSLKQALDPLGILNPGKVI